MHGLIRSPQRKVRDELVQRSTLLDMKTLQPLSEKKCDERKRNLQSTVTTGQFDSYDSIFTQENKKFDIIISNASQSIHQSR